MSPGAAPALQPVGVREAKNRFSELAAEVNERGVPLVVHKNGRPWVTIQPADDAAARRRERLAKLRALTESIERDAGDEPDWDSSLSDKDFLGEERVRRFG